MSESLSSNLNYIAKYKNVNFFRDSLDISNRVSFLLVVSGQLKLQNQYNADIVIVENNYKSIIENKTRFKIHKNRYGRKAYLLNKKELVYILSSYFKVSNK